MPCDSRGTGPVGVERPSLYAATAAAAVELQGRRRLRRRGVLEHTKKENRRRSGARLLSTRFSLSLARVVSCCLCVLLGPVVIIQSSSSSSQLRGTRQTETVRPRNRSRDGADFQRSSKTLKLKLPSRIAASSSKIKSQNSVC